MADIVLVTGGSGYIAGFTIRLLIERGWTVRATLRSLAREAEVRDWLGVDNNRLSFHAVDLMDDAGWRQAMAGCTHVLHMASPVPARAPRHEDDLIRPARDGALRALRFARDAGVSRVVMTSSVAAIVYGVDRGMHRFDESRWTDLNHPDVSAYPKSKTIAERAARDWVAAEGGAMEYCTINPALVFGPLLGADHSASLEVIKRMLEGGLPGMPDLGFAIVDVRDVADLHVRALTSPGMDGERFIAAGRFMKLHELAVLLKTELGAAGRRVPTRQLPDWLVRIVALFVPDARQIVSELGKVRHLDAGHAKRVLGWEARPVEETALDTARSLMALGLVKS